MTNESISKLKVLLTVLIPILLAVIICTVTLIDFPMMGHDYSYIMPLMLDFSVAWKKYEVLNPIYSPLRCLGLPVFANPNSFSLSFLHLYSLFFNPILTTILYLTSFTFIIYFGAIKFTKIFVSEYWVQICFAIGWTLQAHLITNAMVGHISYMPIGFFPLIFAVMMEKQQSIKKEIFYFFILVFLFTQVIFSAALYAVFIGVPSALITIIILYLMKYDFKNTLNNLKYLVIRNTLAVTVSILIALPKLLSVYGWMANYPREIKFINVGILRVLEYSFFNIFIPMPFDAKSSVGWWYGNWESNQSIFPFVVIGLLAIFLVEKDFSRLKNFLFFLVIIFVISVLINSGIYADIFSQLPLLKSLHVNPRWNTIILLPLFTGYLYTISNCLHYFKKRYWYFLILVFLFYPFLFIDRVNNEISYNYLKGYDSAANRLNYCYEPVFGYRLERIPEPIKSLNLYGNQLVDPRCYIKGSKCNPGNLLTEDDTRLLIEYRLK